MCTVGFMAELTDVVNWFIHNSLRVTQQQHMGGFSTKLGKNIIVGLFNFWTWSVKTKHISEISPQIVEPERQCKSYVIIWWMTSCRVAWKKCYSRGLSPFHRTKNVHRWKNNSYDHMMMSSLWSQTMTSYCVVNAFNFATNDIEDPIYNFRPTDPSLSYGINDDVIITI